MKQSNDTVIFLTILFDWFNKHCKYAVLRNYEGLPEQNDSRDIDIAIEKKSYLQIKANLIGLVEQQGWKIVTLLISDRLITWVCGHISSEGKADLIQLDFFFHTSVFGIKFLSSQEVIAKRVFNGKVYHANNDYEFLDKYLYDKAVGATYPEKYETTRERVAESQMVGDVIGRLFGSKSLEECDQQGHRQLLWRAWLYNMKKNAIRTVCSMISFEYQRLRNYFHSTGFCVGFTGPDGAGKTTVIDLLIEQLGNVFRKAHAYYHFRPALFGNLGEVAHSAGIKKDVDRNYSDPHRGGKTGMLSSLARLFYYSIDYIIGYWVKVKPQIRITRLVIFDRYYTDIICDSRRSRIYLNPKFLYRWGKLFIPFLNYNILLTASTDTILARKRELNETGIRNINDKIDYLSGKDGYLKVMNEQTPEKAVVEILSYIFEEQHIKNLKRLK